ncbi:MAG: D-Ala-D-Ala carboxypeptidase family metallohydrolase [Hyphomicrobiaceae bacterium]|nr:D-Ala-D-Ala carboxypeptidase family metallohydrolase [Hyphomicrobiaceae bacterium]
MKLFVRCAILSMAALVVAGCKTTEEPHKLGSRVSKSSPVIQTGYASQGTSWSAGEVEGFGDGSEPETPNWIRYRKKKSTKSALNVYSRPATKAGPLTRIASIRQMAKRLAPIGARLASLSDMVGKRRQAKIGCLPKELRMLLNTVAWHYGKHVHIQSGYRSKHYNRRVGGAKRSYHVACKAVDIQVKGVNKYRLARYLKSLPGRGGVGTYCNNSTVHIDVGPKRQWHYGCGMKSKARRRMARYNKKRSRQKSYK